MAANMVMAVTRRVRPHSVHSMLTGKELMRAKLAEESLTVANGAAPGSGKATALKPDAADPPGRHPFRHTGVCG